MTLAGKSPMLVACLVLAQPALAGGGRDLLCPPARESADAVQSLQEQGDKALAASAYGAAVAAYEAAAAAARAAGREADRVAALRGWAEALYRRGNLDRALPVAEEAVRGSSGLGATEAEAANVLGHIRHARGEYVEAYAAYERAHGIWSAAGDRLNAARALNNLANCDRARSELDAALDRYQQALRQFEELGDRARAAVVTNNIGMIHYFRGDYRQAQAYCSRALLENQAVNAPERVSKSLDSLGNIARERGAYARALDYFRRSLEISDRLGATFQILESWNNLGLVHYRQGDYELAIDAYKRGLRLNRKMGGTTLVPEGLFNIAAAAESLGQHARAVANYRESLRIAERDGFKALAAANLNALGLLALEDGKLAEAGRLLERSLEAREGLKDRAGTTETLNGLALLRLAEKRPQAALDLSRRSAELARTFELAELHWEAETLSGRAYRQLGDAEAARASFREAIRVIEELRREVAPRAQGRERFFERKLSPYHELMALALAAGAEREALELADRAKARALADLVRRADVDDADPLPADKLAEGARLRTALASVNQRLQAERLKEAPDAGRIARLQEERRERRSAYEGFQVSVQSAPPGSAGSLLASRAFAFAEAEGVLRSREMAVLQFVVTEDRADLFVLTRPAEGPQVRALSLALGGRALAPLVHRLRDQLAARDYAFADDARRLYELLLLPAFPLIRGKTQLVIIPDGVLWEVPFQALQDARGRYTIEAAAVSYAPSLAVLREALGARPVASEGPPTLLALGRADFGEAAAAGSPLSAPPPLPDAERQVRAIAAHYGPARSVTRLGKEAREDRFKAEASRHRILHLATHGVLDEASPLYSHVLLAPGTSGSSGDGLLEAWEVLDLKLDADLVVLSACETGRGRIAPGEGIVGTLWTFLVAGARALVVTKWKVESASTTELMSSFHARLARGDGPKAELLRQASLDLLRQPRYAHPFYWAGFVLVGDPQ